ncbi:MAG: RluA family pseudouridine synthase [Peptoniphilaceae bacterium]
MSEDKIYSELFDIRLDKYLSDHIDMSRSQIKKSIDSGEILVNLKKVKAGYLLNKDDEISLNFKEKDELKAENIEFDILYEDDHIAVISKPQDLVVHPGSGNFDHTLVSGLLYKFDKLGRSSDPLRPGIVHRLDKDTSGLMIIAKSEKAYLKLVEDFKNKKIEKSYLAIAEGKLEEEGIINEPIGRDPKQRKKMTVIYKNSKEAITMYKVLKQYNNHALVLIDLITGRTHQIRVHFSHINHPILGDLVYGHKNKYKINKQMLHSYKLKFKHPISGETLEIKDKFPVRFKKFLSRVDI